MRVVPAFDELEHRHPRLDLGLEGRKSAILENAAYVYGAWMGCGTHSNGQTGQSQIVATMAEPGVGNYRLF